MERSIVNNILHHIDSWSHLVASKEDVIITRLNGMSNAVYKVELRPELAKQVDLSVLIYRQFEQDLTDRRIERAMF